MSSGQQVLLKLRKMIISGELEGGARIAEIPTAELLGVSRQPVRIAFRLLEQEGLLIKNPTRGYTVREISEQLVHDALEVRGVLEGLAAKTLAEQGLSEEQKNTLQHCIQETEKLFNDKDEFGDAELERYHHFNVIFHDTIIEGAQNVALIQALAKNINCRWLLLKLLPMTRIKLCLNIVVCTMRIYSIVRFSMHWYIVRQGVLKFNA